jgi:hypothetical protein
MERRAVRPSQWSASCSALDGKTPALSVEGLVAPMLIHAWLLGRTSTGPGRPVDGMSRSAWAMMSLGRGVIEHWGPFLTAEPRVIVYDPALPWQTIMGDGSQPSRA